MINLDLNSGVKIYGILLVMNIFKIPIMLHLLKPLVIHKQKNYKEEAITDLIEIQKKKT